MNAEWFHVANEREIASPALLIFRERVERNIRRMLQIAGGPGRLRPHVKTHKLGPLVRAQIAHGITKFKCATIAEAEMTAEAGAADVLLAFQPVGPAVDRLGSLRRKFPGTAFSTIADSEEAIRALGAAQSAGPLEVLLDVDCGMHRTGVAPGEEAARLYRMIAGTPGLRTGGLHAYDGHIHEADAAERSRQCEDAFAGVVALRERLTREGLAVPLLVAGGTPTLPMHARYADRELSPGTCVLWDFGYGDKFGDMPFEIAAVLLARVVSRPGGNRLCLDLGYKAVASENPLPRVRVLEIPDAAQVMHSEEHLVIETPRAGEFHIGQCLHAVPRHICPTVALHGEVCVVEAGEARERWPVTARARRISI